MLMRSTLLSILVVLLFTPCGIVSQSKETTEPVSSLVDPNDPCGNPLAESQLWYSIKGKVSKIVNGNTILVAYGENQVVRVHLVAIAIADDLSSKKAKQRVGEISLNKEVEVFVNMEWYYKQPKEVAGAVHMREGGASDVGLVLLSEGLARFKEPEPFTMSSHSRCHYRLAEAEARSKKLGLWQ